MSFLAKIGPTIRSQPITVKDQIDTVYLIRKHAMPTKPLPSKDAVEPNPQNSPTQRATPWPDW